MPPDASPDTAASKVTLEELDGGALWRVQLNAPKGNVLDGQMMEQLTEIFVRARGAADLRAVCIEGAGSHFSFGASVAEHMPQKVEGMLDTFHGLLRAMADSSVVLLAAVRGQCLGGGLELASFCHRIFAAADAKLGQPEIRLGVFAPIASLLLTERVGRGVAEDLCLTGRLMAAPAALACGLVDEIVDDPSQAACGYAREHLLAHSASSLRYAVRAIRLRFHQRLFRDLEAMEHLYLEELMATTDAKEGIAAFLEKRQPHWRNQ
jgi:cyclohexa-1,5-dienecarbonyl-CoA hydratase